MLFREKNDDGIELHLNTEERKLIYNALRHYSAYGKDNKYIDDNIVTICEIMNVIEFPECKKGGGVSQ